MLVKRGNEAVLFKGSKNLERRRQCPLGLDALEKKNYSCDNL